MAQILYDTVNKQGDAPPHGTLHQAATLCLNSLIQAIPAE